MTQEQQDKIGEMLVDIHTLIQAAEKKLYELESLFVEAARDTAT